jgi:hypothetical protein
MEFLKEIPEEQKQMSSVPKFDGEVQQNDLSRSQRKRAKNQRKELRVKRRIPEAPIGTLPDPFTRPVSWNFKNPEFTFEEPEVIWDEFEYETIERKWWMEWRVTRKESLPRHIIEHLISKIKSINVLNHISYSDLIAKDQVCYQEGLKQMRVGGVLTWFEWTARLDRFFYAYQNPHTKNIFRLARANSKYAEGQRKTRKVLSDRHVIFTETWDFVKMCAKTVAVGAVIGLSLYVASQVREHHVEAFTGVVNKCRSKLFPDSVGYVDRIKNRLNVQHTLFRSFPVFSVYLEETVKMIPGAWRIVTLLERFKYGDWKTYKWHKKSMQWPYFKRVEEHFKVNRDEGDLKVAYRYFVKFQPDLYVFPPGVEQLDSWEMPSATLSKTLPGRSNSVATINNSDGPKDEKTPAPWYALLWGVTHFLKLGNLDQVLIVCAEEKINAYENSKPEPLYLAAAERYSEQIYLTHIENDLFYDNLKSYQKKNIERVKEAITKGEIKKPEDTVINLNVKTNELINGYQKSVGRPVHDLSGEDFYYTGKITSELSDGLAQQWSSKAETLLTHTRTVPEGGRESATKYCGTCRSEGPCGCITTIHKYQMKFCPFFACGAHSYQLNQFVNHALGAEEGIFQMLMGDDTLLIDRYYIVGEKRGRVIENDFSRYDRTQSKLLRKLMAGILDRSGYAELNRLRALQYLRKILPKRSRGSKIKNVALKTPKGNPVDMRMTGEGATCLDNSVINHVTTAVVMAYEDVTPLQEGFERFGLVAKIKQSDTPEGATFLKGVLLPDADSVYCWIRLPSFLLKFGKVLTDPRLMYPKEKSVGNICKKVIMAQWKGYGDLRVNWFYSRLHEEIVRICGNQDVEAVTLKEWQVVQSPCWIPDEVWNKFMLSRYNITVDGMNNILRCFSNIDGCDLPAVYHVPELVQLLLTDY